MSIMEGVCVCDVNIDVSVGERIIILSILLIHVLDIVHRCEWIRTIASVEHPIHWMR